MLVPWNATWSAEQAHEIRPCRWVAGALAVWAPHRPGEGRPLFAKPHPVRQRMSIKRMLCTVCGLPTPAGDRWWFALGRYAEGWFMTTEAPVHRACAELALEHCPHLRNGGHARDLAPFPGVHTILSSIVGGSLLEDDFNVKLNGRRVIGNLKLAWPQDAISVLKR